MDALRHPEIDLVFVIGPAGSGKTLLSLEAGLTQTIPRLADRNMRKGQGIRLGNEIFRKYEHFNTFNNILVCRPNIGIGKEHGYLPGDLEDKLNVFMGPIYDNFNCIMDLARIDADERERYLSEEKILEIQSLYHLRGRNLIDYYFLVDDSQNLTHHELLTVLTRAGKGTKIVINGDLKQVDLEAKYGLSSSGLSLANESHKYDDRAATIVLREKDVFRSERAKRSVRLMQLKK